MPAKATGTSGIRSVKVRVPRAQVDERRVKVAALREQGLSLLTIAKQLGVPKSMVQRDLATFAEAARGRTGTEVPLDHGPGPALGSTQGQAPQTVEGTMNYYPPQRYVGKFWGILPTVLQGKPADAIMCNIPPEQNSPEVGRRLAALQERLRASHNVRVVEIMVDADDATVATAIETLTRPGDTIVCPLVGNGSVMFSAYHLGRRCVVVGEYEAEVATGKLMGGR